MAQYELTTKQKQALRKEGHVSITRNGKPVRVTPSMVKGRRSHAKTNSNYEVSPVYVVHQNYGRSGGKVLHMVVTPSGYKKLFTIDEIESYLRGKAWRFAR